MVIDCGYTPAEYGPTHQDVMAFQLSRLLQLSIYKESLDNLISLWEGYSRLTDQTFRYGVSAAKIAARGHDPVSLTALLSNWSTSQVLKAHQPLLSRSNTHERLSKAR